MIDHDAAHQALRNRALALTVATTGSASLAQTATGFTRSSGSFVTEGFLIGMEVVPTGFAVNTPGIVTNVVALTLTVTGSRSAEAEAGARTLAVGFPPLVGFEGVPFTPIVGRPYATEEYSPSTSRLLTAPASSGIVEETGDYFITWYGVIAAGLIPGVGKKAIRKSVDALKLLFAPGTRITAGSDVLRVRGEPAPQTGQIIPLTSWSALQLKIPWRAETTNLITA
jgi:hypothetical protein